MIPLLKVVLILYAESIVAFFVNYPKMEPVKSNISKYYGVELSVEQKRCILYVTFDPEMLIYVLFNALRKVVQM